MNPHRYSRYFTYIQPLTKHPVVRTYGTAILTIITLAIFVVFAIKPTVETILVLQKKLEDQRKVLDKINQKAENLSRAKGNFQKLDNNIKSKIQTAIPNSVDLKTLTISLENIARLQQASISALQIQPLTITPSAPLTSKDLGAVDFTFNIEGSYGSLIKILQDLQNNIRLISIDNLIINRVESSDNLLMSVSGKAYYLK